MTAKGRCRTIWDRDNKIPAPQRPEVTTRTHVLQSHNLLPQLCSVRALNRGEQETWVKRGEDTRIVSLVAYLYAAEQKLTMLSWLPLFVILLCAACMWSS